MGVPQQPAGILAFFSYYHTINDVEDVKELLKTFSVFGNHWQCENYVYLPLVCVRQ